MRLLRTLLLCLAGLLCASGATGCALMHELQPHRLQRWNRGNGMEPGFEAYYSVDDPIPGEGRAGD
jgi:hypothetical protein